MTPNCKVKIYNKLLDEQYGVMKIVADLNRG